MIETEDPIRWAEGSAPEGGLALLAQLDAPPPLPPAVRRRVREVVTAELRPRSTIPWRSLLVAATVGLLAFAAGWAWSGRAPAPVEPHLAASRTPEHSEPTPAEEDEPPPEPDSQERGPASAVDVKDEAPAGMEPPRSRRSPRQTTMSPGRATPDPADPFASEATTSRMATARGDVRDPFQPAHQTPDEPVRVSEGETGTLLLNSTPWSRVFIDGQDTGRNTPVTRYRVPAGRHRIGMRTADGTMHEFNVTVPAGERIAVVRRLY